MLHKKSGGTTPSHINTTRHYHTKAGMRFAYLPGTAREADYIYHEIFNLHDYLPDCIQLHEGDCVIDAGANIGLFSLHIMQQFNHIQIHTFEPARQTFDVLQHNMQCHRKATQAIHCNQLALSNHAGETALHYYPHNPANSTLHPALKAQECAHPEAFMRDEHAFAVSPLVGYAFKLTRPLHALYRPIVKRIMQYLQRQPETQRCCTTTLSRYIATQRIDTIDLLKIDVEGHECALLQGLNAQDWPRIRQISMEVSHLISPDHSKTIIQHLEQRGFTVHQPKEKASHQRKAISMLYATRTTP